MRLDAVLAQGLAATAPLWPPITAAYAWVHRAASILGNSAGRCVEEVRCDLRALLYEMAQERERVGTLAAAVTHCRAASISQWAGLFRCYEVAGLQPTNNDLEHLFGSARYYERRAAGRKVASPGLVVRGAVRVVAAIACQGRRFVAADLQPYHLQGWQALRRLLDHRQDARPRQLRFRRAPDAYLSALETTLLKESLPSQELSLGGNAIRRTWSGETSLAHSPAARTPQSVPA